MRGGNEDEKNKAERLSVGKHRITTIKSKNINCRATGAEQSRIGKGTGGLYEVDVA